MFGLYLKHSHNYIDIVKYYSDMHFNLIIPADFSLISMVYFRNTHSCAPVCSQERSRSVQIVKQLLEQKVNIDVWDGNGATPLHHAARRGCVEVVKVLLDRGANCSLKDIDGSNPLDIAIDSGYE